MSTRKLLALLITCGLASISVFASSDNPDTAGGSSEPTLYHSGDIDNINLFNGALGLTIPIGQMYTVDGGFSYKFQLFYSSDIWKLASKVCSDGGAEEFSEPKFSPGGLQLGLGWRLSPFPSLVSAGQQNTFVDSDGSSHAFRLVGENDTTSISQDGDYFRLKDLNATKLVEYPNGYTAVFSSVSKHINDSFGQTVLDYDSSEPGELTITDLAGREHKVFFVSSGPPHNTTRVTKIELQTFGGNTAEYIFNYTATDIERWTAFGGTCVGIENVTINLPLLTSVTLPDGSNYSISQYNNSGPISTPDDPFDQEWAAPAHIKQLTLPTGGGYEWRYSENPQAISGPHRVLSKRIFEAIDLPGSLVGIWRYKKDADKVIIRDPLNNETVNYFVYGDFTTITDADQGWSSHWFKGLPFEFSNSTVTSSHPDTEIDHTLYLSAEIYEGTVSPSNLLLTKYVRYEVDEPGKLNIDPPPPNIPDEQEKRLVATSTVYAKDGDYTVETFKSDYDGLGNFRKTERWDSSTPENILSVSTNYNAFLTGDEDPELISPWLLTTFDYIQTEYAGQTSQTEYCFDRATGFLLRKRTLSEFGLTRNAYDIVTAYQMELSGNTPTGNVATKELYGADITPLTGAAVNGDLCSDELVNALAVSPRGYHQQFSYSNGRLNSTDVLNPLTSEVILRTLNNTIDHNTGLPSVTRTPNEVATTYTYDEQGRLTSQSTPGLPTTTLSYCISSASGCAGVNSIRNLAHSTDGPVSDSTVFFDGLLRKIEVETESTIDESQVETLRTLYQYDELGRLMLQSITEREPSFSGTRYTMFDYDVFDNITVIINPDGAIVTTTYTGARTVTTHYSSGGNPYHKTTIFDPVRDLPISRIEPAGNNGAAAIVNYAYDVKRNLIGVDFGVQSRTFNYNNAGWLIGSSDVETSNTLVNSDFDVLGNAYRSIKGSRTLTTSYDHLGRAVITSEVLAGENRPITESYYAASNSGGDKRAGKLVRVKRHNYIPANPADPALTLINHFVITERYKYIHPAGLLTQSDTSTVAYDASGVFHNRRDLLFEMTLGYNAAGSPESTGYPSAIKVGGPTASLNLTYQYNHGLPVAVADTSQPLVAATYSRGIRSSLSFVNGNRQDISLDVSGIPRVGEITLTNIMEDVIWSSGIYNYDKSENITGIDNDIFDYDGVGRLTRGVVSNLVQTAQYDQYGNITQLITDGEGVPFCVDPDTNRLSDMDGDCEVDGVSYSYDEFGNITHWNDRVLSYDAFNMVSASNFSNHTRYFIYGPDNQRIGVQDNLTNEIKWTVRGAAKNVLSEFSEIGNELSWKRDYVYSGSSLMAARHPGPGGVEYRYFHADHLSSTRLVSDQQGTVVAEYDYFPFGGFAFKSGVEAELETHLFTGHERDSNDELDANDDLDYMRARYYAPYLGRFLSIDPIMGNAINPQSWNRYAYVRNNPLSLVDPTGKVPSAGQQIIEQRLLEREGESLAEKLAKQLKEDNNGVRAPLTGSADQTVIDEVAAGLNDTKEGKVVYTYSDVSPNVDRGPVHASEQNQFNREVQASAESGAKTHPVVTDPDTGGQYFESEGNATRRGGAQQLVIPADDVNKIRAFGKRAFKKTIAAVPYAGTALTGIFYGPQAAAVELAKDASGPVGIVYDVGDLAVTVGGGINSTHVGQSLGGAISEFVSDVLCNCN